MGHNFIYIWASIARHPHPMVMGLHSSAPVPLFFCGVGGGGRSYISMYMNIYIWCEYMFLILLSNYNIIYI